MACGPSPELLALDPPVPGQPDRIFGFSNDGPDFDSLDMNWGALDLEPFVAPSDGRTPADLVRMTGGRVAAVKSGDGR